MRGRIVDMEYQFSFTWSSLARKEFGDQRDYVLINKPCCIERRSRRQHCQNVEAVGIPQNGQHIFRGRNGPVRHFWLFSSHAVQIFSLTYS
jgi:hypothetical protein